MKEDILLYRVRIKEWEKQFAAEHGRKPSKSDIKAEPEIYGAYKAYNLMKSGKTEKRSKKGDPQVNDRLLPIVQPEIPKYPSFDFAGLLTDDEEKVDKNPVPNAELGPTPQANGKVLSIFDMVLSPPESSPLKMRSKALHSSPLKQEQVFKTPTKAPRKLQFTDLTPSAGGKSIFEKLQQESMVAEVAVEPIVETPFYLGKVNNKFLFQEVSQSKAEEPSTPTRALSSPVINFQVSPSPLKSQRFLSFGSNKKVSDIFNDYKSLQIDEALKIEIENEFLSEPEDDELPLEAPSNVTVFSRKRKRITQKRTTRNWKIKPKSDGQDEDTFNGKNVHDEIKKINEMEQQKMADYIEGVEKEEEETDDDEVYSRPVSIPQKPGKKPKTLSDNYQRLKINDPRLKRFKQRMKRR